jgi:hypothetical protein
MSTLSIRKILIWIQPWIQPNFQAQFVSLIPPSYSEVSISDTREHPLGVYLEKESLYFNIT